MCLCICEGYDEARELARRSRSPSPEPIYGQDGHRANTRPVVWREKLVNERQRLIAKATTISSAFVSANQAIAAKVKFEARVPIPRDK